jgi:predicted DCC family thiol-disulfide oxidoreductase YuxK
LCGAIAYSYRQDPGVPAFDDSKPLFVFDGHCVLCSRGVSLLMRIDKGERLRFTSSQSALGQALHAHFHVYFDDSYLLVHEGRSFTMSDGYLELCRIMGGTWRLFLIFGWIPRSLRDRVYSWVARNRYRWFGSSEQCALLTAEQRASLLARVAEG